MLHQDFNWFKLVVNVKLYIFFESQLMPKVAYPRTLSEANG